MKSFVVIFTNGTKIKNTIHYFYLVEEYVYHCGTDTIKKIIFDFYIINQKREYFPYGIHNIVIENAFFNKLFNVTFYHYINPLNVKIELPIEEQKTDFYTLLRLLDSTYCIYYYLGQYIINPFYISPSEIKEEKELIE